ncbi:GSCOCG00013368001-RA-CDS [Cotesia congregata]|uniref:Uncharacterized protein n=1 Tax=Cotesia congregata TaxID=51543 RepID=A0A8J2EAJ5_COTCN|nr:GSCOCG00013368001-RA-CDS [Cotesia congregata]CAG5075254.1 Protein of unknown function [Cotesia congregata]
MKKFFFIKIWIFTYLVIITAELSNITDKLILEPNSPDVKYFAEKAWYGLDLRGEHKTIIENCIKADSKLVRRVELFYQYSSILKAQVEIVDEERRYIILVDYIVQVKKKIKYTPISKSVPVEYKCIVYVHTEESNPIQLQCFVNGFTWTNLEQRNNEIVYNRYYYEH